MDEDNGGLWHADIFPQLSPPVSRTAATATATVLGVSIVVVRVSVSGPRPLGPPSSGIVSSIAKERVTLDHLELSELNLDGDDQADRRGHGGEHRAVLVYQLESYDFWQRHFGRDDFEWGQFGENFTVTGLRDDDVHIGDRYRIGSAQFEVTQPRVTCYRVGVRLGEPTMAVDTHVFRIGNRTGLAPGKDPLEVELALVDAIPAEFMLHAHHWLILHGRYICVARKPRCDVCLINDLCKWPEKTVPA